MKARFQFGQVVVVEDYAIGVICKTWRSEKSGYHYDVYVRSYNSVHEYREDDIQAFVFSKEISDEEMGFYEITP